MLRIINIYQVISGLLSLYAFFLAFLQALNSKLQFSTFVISFLLLLCSIYFIFTNLYLLIKNKDKRAYINFNRWVNLLQIVQISILGFTYYFVLGLVAMPYFSYKENMNLLWQGEFYNLRAVLFFHPGNTDIQVGINLIPLIIYLCLNNLLSKGTKFKSKA